MSNPILRYGADYNPDQWLDRPDILAQDIELMKKAHVNVVSLGIFAWSTLEPEEGKYNLDWMTDIIERLYAAGVMVDLATPSGARPAWMARKYPEVLRVSADRKRNLFGGRHNHCYTSPIYREKVKQMNQQLARRFGRHPAVIMWHLSNEYGGECHCELCQQAFRAWLKEKYGTIETLNKAWNAKFWSHDYPDFDAVESPAPHGERAVHGLKLDWKRFVSHQTIDFMKWERDCVREIVPDAPVCVNMMNFYPGIDYFEMAKEIDLATWDAYPTWHHPEQTVEQTALDTGMMHDLMYSVKSKPFWLMENCPGPTNWQPISKTKKPGVNILAAMQTVAHGADGVLFFQWRQAQGSSEKFHAAMVEPISKTKKPGVNILAAMQTVAHGADGVLFFQWRQAQGSSEKFHAAMVAHDCRDDNRNYVECAELGSILEQISADVCGAQRDKQAAIVYDWNSRWALEDAQGPRNEGVHFRRELLNHYAGLRRNGIDVQWVNQDGDLSGYKLVVAPMLYLLREDFAQKLRDFVSAGGTLVVTYDVQWVNQDGDLSGYKLVVAPMLYLLREDFAQKLRDFVSAGGTLVVTYWSGVVNETDLCYLGDTPHMLTDVLGVRRLEIDAMYDGETRRCTSVCDALPKTACGSLLCEVAALEGAEPLMVYDEDFFAGAPAVTTHSFGKGKAYYIATRFDEAFYTPLYAHICEGCVSSCYPGALPEGVLALARGCYVFLLNTTNDTVTVDQFTLAPYGTVILRREGDKLSLAYQQKPFTWKPTV